MARIAGVNIPTQKRVEIGLRYIHGIGSAKAKEIITRVVPRIPTEAHWPEHRALDHAIITDRKYWPEETKLRLETLLERFLKE